MQQEPVITTTETDGSLVEIRIEIGDEIRVFTRKKLRKLLRRNDSYAEKHPYDEFEKAALRRYKQPPSAESFEAEERKAQQNSLGYVDHRDRLSVANGG